MSTGRPPVFDELLRTDSTPARHGESSYEFLNRVAGDFWSHERDLVQAWADRVGDPHYADLRARLRSRDNHEFNSAFLELYLHEAFRAGGYTVIVHPAVADSPRRPDFWAERDGRGMYVEAIAPGATPRAKAAANRRRVLFDTVNSVRDPNFFLWLDELSDGEAPPSGAALRRDLRAWLRTLAPDDYADLDQAPTFRWVQDGWSATFKAIPKAEHARGPAGADERAIGVFAHQPVQIVDDAPAIRAALVEKAGAYGNLEAPYVIAVGLYIFDHDHWHSTAALYGAEALQIGVTDDGERTSRLVRNSDGFFGAPPDWANADVSGVILVNQLQPHSVLSADVILWRHPAPLHPLPDDLQLPVHQVRFVAGRLVGDEPKCAAAAHFGLPDPWPPGEPWPNTPTRKG
ncbi:hypothetical protein ACFO3K_01900 [Cellulomonas algicola]|uniref:hypothetical protein n=1 Tax=Cellulomonas algicola TaxID=2071633 RepID=UPI001C3FBB1E|nr:hypothetical protein [Cellulomonas algicola]